MYNSTTPTSAQTTKTNPTSCYGKDYTASEQSRLTLDTGQTKDMFFVFFSKMKACSSNTDNFINGEKIKMVTD